MRRFLYILSALAGLLSCSGYVDYEDPNNVPEGVLRVFADKTSIKADGTETVTFTVRFGSKDVSQDNNMNLVFSAAGNETTLRPGVNVFTATTPAEYHFKARYYSSGAHYSDNEVVVKAVSAAQSVGKKDYHQKLWGMQFTAVSCTYCPRLTASLKTVMAEDPDRIVLTAFHVAFDETTMPDPMRLNINEELRNIVKHSEGLPLFAFNMLKSRKGIVDQLDLIQEQKNMILADYPASCGVAVAADYDPARSEVTVTGKVTSNVAEAMRYHIILVEDGVEYAQMGSDADTYVHDNVVRAVVAENKWGDNLNSGLPLEEGVEVSVRRTIRLNNAWNPANMRAVMVAMSEKDGQYVCNNVNECAFDSSSDYAYREASQYVRNVCLMEFTDASCSFCPDASRYIDRNILSKNKNVHLMAFHEKDQWKSEQYPTLFSKFKFSATPAAAVDMRRGISLESGNRDALKEAIAESESDYPAYCAVALSSFVDEAGQAKINIKVKSEKSTDYYVAVYVVEDGIIGAQLDGSLTEKSYYHQYVVRRMLSSTVYGDVLGMIAPGQERSKDYSLTCSPDWNKAKTYVYALVLDSEGLVNNMQVCQLDGGDVDYEKTFNR